jgi:hypothetical protein
MFHEIHHPPSQHTGDFNEVHFFEKQHHPGSPVSGGWIHSRLDDKHPVYGNPDRAHHRHPHRFDTTTVDAVKSRAGKSRPVFI